MNIPWMAVLQPLVDHPIEGTLFLALLLLSMTDTVGTIYSLHRWVGHAFENGRGTVAFIRLLHNALPALRMPIVQDLAIVVWASAFYPLLYWMLQWINGPVGILVWLVAIAWRCRTLSSNLALMRSLRIRFG